MTNTHQNEMLTFYICAKKWPIDHVSCPYFYCSVGMKLWQVAEGKKFIQLIYDIDGKLLDCEYLHDGAAAKEFVAKFESEAEVFVDKVHVGGSQGNVTVQHVRLLTDVDSAIREMVNYRRLRRGCKRLHRFVRKFQQQQPAAEGGKTGGRDRDLLLAHGNVTVSSQGDDAESR